MREVLIREYEILISAPADVYCYVEAVKKGIELYNNEQGGIDHIRFIHKNWKEHTIPAYGKSAQEIINEQLTNQVEIVIALFGAKFGEPTEKYSSGTLEEIETVHKNGGHVLTYFCSGKLDVNSIDPEQLKKVREYKKTYHGLYGEFSVEDELIRKICNNLTRLAVKLTNSAGKDLKLYAVKNGELSDCLSFEQYDFFNFFEMDERRNELKALIEKIRKIIIEKPIPIQYESSEDYNCLPNFMKAMQINARAVSSIAPAFPKEDINFSKELYQFVNVFSKEYGITISDDFFDIGDAGYSGNSLMGYELSGKDNEKKKAKLLLELEEKILIYYHLVEFLQQYKDKYYLVLAIKNESNIFADDITVRLYFDQGILVSPSSLSLKERDIGEIVKNFPEALEHKDNVDIENMDYGKADYPNFIPYVNPLTHISSEPNLEYYQDYFNAEIDELYPILINEKGGKTVVKIDIKSGLKQFSSQFLCASLILTQTVNSIKYCVTSKSFGHEIKDEIKTCN